MNPAHRRRRRCPWTVAGVDELRELVHRVAVVGVDGALEQLLFGDVIGNLVVKGPDRDVDTGETGRADLGLTDTNRCAPVEGRREHEATVGGASSEAIFRPTTQQIESPRVSGSKEAAIGA